ncbi:MAG: hypothetical protein AABY44_03680 [Nitrospirota bacterium]
MEKILKAFKGEEIHIDPTLKGTVPDLRPLKEVIRGVESGLSPAFKNSSDMK